MTIEGVRQVIDDVHTEKPDFCDIDFLIRELSKASLTAAERSDIFEAAYVACKRADDFEIKEAVFINELSRLQPRLQQ